MRPAARVRRVFNAPATIKITAALAALMIGTSMLVSSWTNYRYRADREAAFDVQQEELEALRGELECRARESSHATLLEGEITREGWRALTIWAITGEGDDPRIIEAAERVAMLYEDLGPALIDRREASATCAGED